MPVPNGWYGAYACGDADTGRYQEHRKECVLGRS